MVTGKHEGVTGMVVKVEAHILVILSDTTKEDVNILSYKLYASMYILMFTLRGHFIMLEV